MRAVLLLVVAPVLIYASCIKECIKTNSYYKKSCPDGIALGEECNADGEKFCSAPYSRCMDGKCSCLPDFSARNMTEGLPQICVPNTASEADMARDPTADVCRYSDPAGETFAEEVLTAEIESAEYNELINLPSQEECECESKKRVKRQSSYILPPTVVNSCRSGQLCFQLGPSAYGVCKRPSCPVGKAGSTKTPCTIGDDSTCPTGYHCNLTGGQSFDVKSGKYADATICCPTVCNNGYFRNGQCWRDEHCLNVQNDCEDRCHFAPCRFMVDPCRNYGMCLVPKTLPGVSPDYFWCKCSAGSGKAGRVCEQDGVDLNRPSASRRIDCEGSLCEAPPVPVSLEPAQPITPLVPALSAAVSQAFNYQPTRRTMTCRQDTDPLCAWWAHNKDCTEDRKKMLSKCDCTCTKLMNKNQNIQYIPIPSYTSSFNTRGAFNVASNGNN